MLASSLSARLRAEVSRLQAEVKELRQLIPIGQHRERRPRLPVHRDSRTCAGDAQGLLRPGGQVQWLQLRGGEAGEAGSLMIVTRDLGTSVGIAMAASLLSWQLRLLTGGASTLNASGADLTSAIRMVVIVLALLALLAAVMSWVRPTRRAP